MRVNPENCTSQNFKGQRGAALITVLMISALLLATGGTLILVSSLSARTTIDATAEMQAYYSAEAGLQDSLNVLRGNVNPNAAMPAGSKIDFRKAINLATSNRPGDNHPTPRLSGWLNYNYTSQGQASPDRVALTANYSPLNGLAYSVEVSDPDGTAPGIEPPRLLLRVFGYGPKGAEKHLELIVKRTSFEYNPKCVICSISSENGIPMNFSAGDSAAKDYSGEDRAGGGQLSVFGATSPVDTAIQIADADKNTFSDPVSITINNSDLPSWAQSANEARAFLADQKANAINQGRYFSTFSGYSGSDAAPVFTYVDGDCELDGGAGLLIVTGKLLMKGNPSFRGLILVLGEGYVERDGGGQGNIYGAMFIARFNKNAGPFLAPTFMTNGGGNSNVQNDSSAWGGAQNLSGPRVLGVHEY
jgi:hypothetical protein